MKKIKKYKYSFQRQGEPKIEFNLQYTLKYSKSGINQYARVGITDDGKVLILDFRPTWVKVDEIPLLENKTFDEVLQTLKEFSYGGRVEIYKINGVDPRYYKKPIYDKRINNSSAIIEKVIHDEIYKFFVSSLLPLIKKKKLRVSHSWCNKPILVYKDRKGVWDNYKDNYFIEYLSYMFLRQCNLTDGVNFEKEGNTYLNHFGILAGYIENEEFEKLDIYHENNEN